METLDEKKKKIYCAGIILIFILSAYFAVKIYSELRKDTLLGENTTPATISFSGHGEINTVPDIANIYFTITKDATTVKDAQAGVATIEKSALSVLKTKGVADADIQTADASFNPKYEYKQAICPSSPIIPTPVVPMNGGAATPNYVVGPTYCNPGKQVIVGYTASESITVKVRNTDSVGDIMQALGTTGVSGLSGPDFSIDNPDALQAQARKLAIDDAKAKAQVLAKDLGVTLGKIESFSDNSSSPIMYAENKTMSLSAAVPAAAPAVIPKGQNTITSDVTITYEIR